MEATVGLNLRVWKSHRDFEPTKYREDYVSLLVNECKECSSVTAPPTSTGLDKSRPVSVVTLSINLRNALCSHNCN